MAVFVAKTESDLSHSLEGEEQSEGLRFCLVQFQQRLAVVSTAAVCIWSSEHRLSWRLTENVP